MKYDTLQSVISAYKNTESVHRDIYFSFKSNVNETPFLKSHRDYVVQRRHGYGNRAFHWLWKLFVDEMPDNFKFLEIGVFKGQVMSLVALCASKINKRYQQYGVTPLDTTDGHPNDNYEQAILEIFYGLVGNIDNVQIIEGLSTDPSITATVKSIAGGGFDLVYIDGGQDRKSVV